MTFLVLVAIVPIAVTGYLAYNSGRQSIVKAVESHLHSVAILKEQEIENWVDHLEHTMVWLATSPQVNSDATVLATHNTDNPRYLAAYESLTAEFNRMALMRHMFPIFLLDSTSGQIVASSEAAWEGKFRESEQYFIQGKDSTYVSDIYHSLALGQPTMVISTPVEDSRGQLVGVLAGHANLAQLSEVMLERSGLGETGETYLVNKNNLLLTESRFEPGTAFKKWVFTEGVSHYLDYRGMPAIGAYRWLADREMALLAEIDQAEALAPVNRLRNAIFMVAGIVFAIAAVIGVLLTRQITNPLKKLTEYTRRVGEGEYTAEVEVTGRDEVASVASDVKTMVRQLLQMQERLLASERLATLGQFSGSISHELRNPLGVIDSSAYYLKTKLKDAGEKVAEHLDRIKSSVGSATAIIESLLNLNQNEGTKANHA